MDGWMDGWIGTQSIHIGFSDPGWPLKAGREESSFPADLRTCACTAWTTVITFKMINHVGMDLFI